MWIVLGLERAMHLILSIRVVAETGLVGLICNDLGVGSIVTGLKKEIKVGGRREIKAEILNRELD